MPHKQNYSLLRIGEISLYNIRIGQKCVLINEALKSKSMTSSIKIRTRKT